MDHVSAPYNSVERTKVCEGHVIIMQTRYMLRLSVFFSSPHAHQIRDLRKNVCIGARRC